MPKAQGLRLAKAAWQCHGAWREGPEGLRQPERILPAQEGRRRGAQCRDAGDVLLDHVARPERARDHGLPCDQGHAEEGTPPDVLEQGAQGSREGPQGLVRGAVQAGSHLERTGRGPSRLLCCPSPGCRRRRRARGSAGSGCEGQGQGHPSASPEGWLHTTAAGSAGEDQGRRRRFCRHSGGRRDDGRVQRDWQLQHRHAEEGDAGDEDEEPAKRRPGHSASSAKGKGRRRKARGQGTSRSADQGAPEGAQLDDRKSRWSS
mmetsp:Transcript_10786/g.32475  ORF Transcript_10786/g.32475 Transcript_10786/m.32475 type:complete len:261 (-) Transcript_10786:526-1308(-)